MDFEKKKKTNHYGTRAPLSMPKSAPKEGQEGAIAGRNAVSELLKSCAPVDKLFVKRGEREGSIRQVVAMAIDRGIPVMEVDQSKLDFLAGPVKHQGVVAMAAQKEYASLDDLFDLAAQRGEDPFFVIADNIEDPHNLGAMIRCAEGAGAHGVIVPKRHATGLTAVVAKSSAGALNHMHVVKVSNLHTTVLELQKRGVWIYVAEADGTNYSETDLTGPAAFLFGSEGNGVSPLLRATADFTVSLPMRGKVNSLNVSAATAIILYESARQRDVKKNAKI